MQNTERLGHMILRAASDWTSGDTCDLSVGVIWFLTASNKQSSEEEEAKRKEFINWINNNKT